MRVMEGLRTSCGGAILANCLFGLGYGGVWGSLPGDDQRAVACAVGFVLTVAFLWRPWRNARVSPPAG